MKTALFLSVALACATTVFSNGYEPGDEAINFELMNVDGKMVSLSHYPDAKGFIVIFTTNHCPYSIAYEDRIIELDKTFKGKGYPVIAINPNNPAVNPVNSFDNMKVRAKDKGFTFPYLLDETQAIARTYGAQRTPHVYLLAKENGKLMVKYVGAIDNNYQDASAASKRYVVDATEALMSGRAVKVTQTKAIGCGIDWK